MDRLGQDIGLLIDSTLTTVKTKLSIVPGSSIVLRYIASSYKNDPIRSIFELLLLLFAIRYFLASKYSYSKKNYVQLSDSEIDELVQDWEPEPLVKPLNEKEKWNLDTIPVIEGSNGPIVRVDDQEMINLTNKDIYNINNNTEIKSQALQTIREYGVGSCGPAGFYGNQDAHVDCEEAFAKFLGTQSCILYAQGLATITSVIPCFMKRNDVIIADDKVNISIQKGMLLSRANLFWFKHNDMNDLEQAMIKANRSHQRRGGPIPRRFIVTEGVFENCGDSPDMKKIVELKHKYKYRLLLDETNSLGVLGATGRGLVEEAGVSRDEVEITVAILSGPFGAAGGICAGTKTMVEHQRITSLSYTFSATMPPYLARTSAKVTEYFNDAKFRKSNLQLLSDKSREFSKILESNSNIEILSRLDVPTLVLKAADNTKNSDELLQQVVDSCREQGIFVSRHRRLPQHEIFAVEPTIRIFVNNGLSKVQLKKAAQTLSKAFDTAVA